MSTGRSSLAMFLFMENRRARFATPATEESTLATEGSTPSLTLEKDAQYIINIRRLVAIYQNREPCHLFFSRNLMEYHTRAIFRFRLEEKKDARYFPSYRKDQMDKLRNKVNRKKILNAFSEQ
ncbi:hypothetical protein ACJX0J_025274, partial [Zea mays]